MSDEVWQVWRRPAVAAYTVNLREDGRDLRGAIASLAQGVPTDAVRIDAGPGGPEFYEWLEARHWIYFIVDRVVNRRRIIVTQVESATV